MVRSNDVSWLVLIVALALGAWFFWDQEDWTLMVCKEKLNDAECYSNSYVIPGFTTEKECMLEGASRFSKEGFVCGNNCKVSEYGLRVCKEVCNSSGCSK
jgi:hypothetical protein